MFNQYRFELLCYSHYQELKWPIGARGLVGGLFFLFVFFLFSLSASPKATKAEQKKAISYMVVFNEVLSLFTAHTLYPTYPIHRLIIELFVLPPPGCAALVGQVFILVVQMKTKYQATCRLIYILTSDMNT